MEDDDILLDYPALPIDPSDLALRPLYFDPNFVISSSTPPEKKQNVAEIDELRTLTKASSSTICLNTTELLEQILENCLFIDLLTRLPRVSSTWKCVIENSRYIQQDLFFTPWAPGEYAIYTLFGIPKGGGLA